jgi:hypothetical protein
MQCAVNRAIEEDVFSMDLPRDYEACPKSIQLYFFPEKPVMAGWQISSQWWGGPSCACVICCGLAQCVFLP